MLTIWQDIEPKKKAVANLLFESDTFERYLKGEVRSVVRNQELLVYEASHPPADIMEEDDDSDDEACEEEEAWADWDGPRYNSARPLSPYEDEGDGDEDEGDGEDDDEE